LHERLPKVAAVFGTGVIDYRMMVALVNRSDDIEDPAALAKLDAALAKWAPKWMKLSGPKLTERIDMWVEKFDPIGVRERAHRATTGMWRSGRRALREWPGSGGACRSPRPLRSIPVWMQSRRQCAATMAARPVNFAPMRWWRCSPVRPSWRVDAAPRTAPPHSDATPLAEVVIHVLAEQSAVDGHSENPGYLTGFGPVPAPLLRELAATATVKPLLIPPPVAEAGYRPTAKLARFVRCRDLTCRFPGCDAPAEVCDIYHTIPYPVGPTHPSNLKLLCRFQDGPMTFCRVGWRGDVGVWGPGLAGPGGGEGMLARKVSLAEDGGNCRRLG
jgi:hypothetical protein